MTCFTGPTSGMDYVLYLIGVLIVVLGVGASIALHEIGHLVPAKKFGVRVPQYMVGFGPTIWSTKRGETEYGIKAIPLGGYIRMIGMFPPRNGEGIRVSSTGRFTQLRDEARNQSMSEILPGDEERVFYKLSVPKKVAIMMGGPLMNLLIAAVVFTGLFTLHGITINTAKLDSVSQCVDISQAAQSTKTTCTADMPIAPANAAGLKPGDQIVSINGTTLATWDDARGVIRANAGKPISLVVRTNGVERTVTATPMAVQLPVYDRYGLPLKNDDGTIRTELAGFLGAAGTPEVQRQPLTAVPGLFGDQLRQTAGVILNIPQKMVGVAKAAFGDQERDLNGPVSVVGVGRVAGEVASDKAFGDAGDKALILVALLGSLNMALFVFNMVPLLPLDGGHVAGALWEGLKRRTFKLFGKADPGPVDVTKALPLAYTVASLLIVMSALLMYADIVNPIRLRG
ncbi:site-2 protease family protein [Nostocoides veronense]|uniref:Site-2 protease family protein n=1 Tax=Nostocoides veronense TaxID=330836 RepID=A0ABN2LZ99_9MICO